jgi:hypothetical protein
VPSRVRSSAFRTPERLAHLRPYPRVLVLYPACGSVAAHRLAEYVSIWTSIVILLLFCEKSDFYIKTLIEG